MPAGSSGLDFSQVTQLARELNKMPAATRRQLRRTFQAAGQPMLADAQSRAGWSTRIPGAIRVSTTVSADRMSVQLRVSSASAPHARPYEGLGGGGFFRHPVYGRRTAWVSQATRPYALPAVKAASDKLVPELTDAYEAAARECGFR
ncbi:MAG: hypothetical protein JWO98_4732 [Frankiales bacterium]|nr:hypothetical protein [Frankiales bacterium]